MYLLALIASNVCSTVLSAWMRPTMRTLLRCGTGSTSPSQQHQLTHIVTVNSLSGGRVFNACMAWHTLMLHAKTIPIAIYSQLYFKTSVASYPRALHVINIGMVEQRLASQEREFKWNVDRRLFSFIYI